MGGLKKQIHSPSTRKLVESGLTITAAAAISSAVALGSLLLPSPLILQAAALGITSFGVVVLALLKRSQDRVTEAQATVSNLSVSDASDDPPMVFRTKASGNQADTYAYRFSITNESEEPVTCYAVLTGCADLDGGALIPEAPLWKRLRSISGKTDFQLAPKETVFVDFFRCLWSLYAMAWVIVTEDGVEHKLEGVAEYIFTATVYGGKFPLQTTAYAARYDLIERPKVSSVPVECLRIRLEKWGPQ